MEEQKVAVDEGSFIGRMLRFAGPLGFIAVDAVRVNIDDLLAPNRPGKIVRCRGNPSECIQVFSYPDTDALGCVAGWVSED